MPDGSGDLVKYYNRDYSAQLQADEKLGYHAQGGVKKALGPLVGLKILDVGCGTGSVSEFLTKANEVHGLDCAVEAVMKAKEKGIHAVAHDIEKEFPFKDETFNVVICRETFEHLIRPSETLGEICRVLAKDGILFVTVPNHFSIQKRLRILAGRGIVGSCNYFPDHQEWNYPHIRFYTYRGFATFLNAGGFEIVRHHSPVFWPLKWVPWEVWNQLAKWSPDLFLTGFRIVCSKRKGSTGGVGEDAALGGQGMRRNVKEALDGAGGSDV